MKASTSSNQPGDSGRAADVVLDVDVDGDRVHLVLANCGDAVATEVTVEFSRPLAGIGDAAPVSSLPVFQRLGILRPGRVLRVFWGATTMVLGRKADVSPFVATVTWNERSQSRQRAEYHHDLSIYRQWPQAGNGRNDAETDS